MPPSTPGGPHRKSLILKDIFQNTVLPSRTSARLPFVGREL